MKKRTLDEYRQTKEYDGRSAWTLNNVDKAHKMPREEQIQEIERDYIEEAKIEIADKVFKKLNDMIFEMVCEEMGKRHVFQSQNYLTEAGMDEFEDQFFEFYHEHHGDILAQIQNKLDVDEVLDASH